MQSHLGLCPDATVPTSVMRVTSYNVSSIPAHHKRSFVTCKYSEAGCNVRLTLFRQDLQIHVSESTEHHLNLAMGRISTLKRHLRDAEEKNRTQPVTFKMSHFAEKKNDSEWISPTFYTVSQLEATKCV